MDRVFEQVLRDGIEALALAVDEPAIGRLVRFADRLTTWNRKVNLTAITDPAEMAEKHFLDSLVLLPSLEGRTDAARRRQRRRASRAWRWPAPGRTCRSPAATRSARRWPS